MNNCSKLTAIFLLAALPFLAWAQSKNVTSAINYMKYYDQGKSADDLLEAKKYIDMAADHEETKLKAKTWFNKGYVYQEVYKSADPKVTLDKAQALETMYNAYKECIKLDAKGDFKNAEFGIRFCLAEYNKQASKAYEANDFATAYKFFMQSANGSEEALKAIDTTTIFNATLSADKASMYPEAINGYNRLIEMKYGGVQTGPRLYGWLAAVYEKQNDQNSYLATLQKGRGLYPDDKNLIITELNYYLTSGKSEEAIKNLNLAIEKDPSNAVLHYNLGVLYDGLANPKDDKVPANFEEMFSKSDACYDKALSLNPDYYDAVFNKGALYYNRGVKQNNFANTITDMKKYDIESKKADEWFAKALPFMENAEKMAPDAPDAKKTLYTTLSSLYRMMGQMDKEKLYREKAKGL